MLTEKQEKFVNEYLTNGRNQYQALLVAYPASRNWKRKSADSKAYVLMCKDEIRQRIKEADKASIERSIVTAKDVLDQCKNISMADVRQLFSKEGTPVPPQDLPEAIAKAIIAVDVIPTEQGYMYKYKLSNKDKTLDLLAKILGMLDRKQEERPPEVNIGIVYGGGSDDE